MKKDRKQAIIDAGIFPGLIQQIFPDAKETGENQVLVKCIFHDDSNPSLSVNTATGLFNCFACSAAGNGIDLYMKSKGVDFKTALAELENIAGITHDKPSSLRAFPQVVATFIYHDEQGNRRYWKKRYEPGFEQGRKKSFAFYHDEQGKEKKGRGGDPLLYNLHILAKAPEDHPLFFLEGEKKADVLTGWGLYATTLDSGGQSGKGSAWRPAFKKYFQNRDVYILPDNDETGESYATALADHLLSVARSVRILRLPGLPPKGDIIDWIRLNGDRID